jgi:hypothetical protein
MTRWLGVALVAVGLLAAPADADVLCRAKASRVVLRARCRSREVRLDFPKGPVGDEGPAGVPVRIVDSAGLPVGLFAEPFTSETNVAVFEVGSRLVSLRMGRTGFRTDNPGFYHLVANCSGQRLAPSDRPAPFVRAGFVVGTTAYYAEDPLEPMTPVAREFPPEGTCGGGLALGNGNCCVTGVFGEGYYGPATVAVELPSLGLKPPFHLEP